MERVRIGFVVFEIFFYFDTIAIQFMNSSRNYLTFIVTKDYNRNSENFDELSLKKDISQKKKTIAKYLYLKQNHYVIIFFSQSMVNTTKKNPNRQKKKDTHTNNTTYKVCKRQKLSAKKEPTKFTEFNYTLCASQYRKSDDDGVTASQHHSITTAHNAVTLFTLDYLAESEEVM